MNRYLRRLFAALVVCAWPLAATAVESPSPSPSTSASPSPSASVRASATPNPAGSARLNNLKTRGTAEINRRIASLNAALEKLKGSTRLTPADRDALIKQVQDELTGLAALKTKLAAQTDLQAARSDVQSIVTDYRVYALMLPKARLVASADRMTTAITKLKDLEAMLQTRLTAAESNGKDVTELKKSLTDMQAKLASATNQLNGLTAKILAVTPADTNASRTALLAHRQALATAHSDLKAARVHARTIVDGLKAL